jgi:hypothetical protein
MPVWARCLRFVQVLLFDAAYKNPFTSIATLPFLLSRVTDMPFQLGLPGAAPSLPHLSPCCASLPRCTNQTCASATNPFLEHNSRTRVPRTTAQFTKPPNQKPSQFLNIYSSIIIYLIKTILGLFDSA